MAVVVTAVSHGFLTGPSPGNVLTFSHVSDGNPLYVQVALTSGSPAIQSVTFDGSVLERVGYVTVAGSQHHVYYLQDPPVTTANVVITHNGTNWWLSGGARSVSGADRDGVLRNFAVAGGTGTAATITIAATSGDLVVDLCTSNGNPQTFTVGAGQTSHWTETGGATRWVSGASEEPGAASVTMSWTLSVSASWELSAFVIPADGTIAPLVTRVTQDVIELVSQPAAPALRVTQDVVETLSVPSPALRVTQDVIEILTGSAALTGDPSVTQLLVETVSHPTPDARITQLLVETLTSLASGVVPNVVGLTLPDATTALVAAGFVVGTVTEV